MKEVMGQTKLWMGQGTCTGIGYQRRAPRSWERKNRRCDERIGVRQVAPQIRGLPRRCEVTQPLPSAWATHAALLCVHPCALGTILVLTALCAMVLPAARARGLVAAAKAAQRRRCVDSGVGSPSPEPASRRAAVYVHVSGRREGRVLRYLWPWRTGTQVALVTP